MARALIKYDLFYSYVSSDLKNCHYFKDGFLLCHPLVPKYGTYNVGITEFDTQHSDETGAGLLEITKWGLFESLFVCLSVYIQFSIVDFLA